MAVYMVASIGCLVAEAAVEVIPAPVLVLFVTELSLTLWLSASCRAEVEAPDGRAEDETTTAPVLTAVTLALSAAKVVSVANPVIAAGGVSVVVCAAVSTTGTEAAARA